MQVTNASVRRTAAELAPLLPELAPGLNYMAEEFTKAFIQRVLQRLGSNDQVMPASQLNSTMAALGMMPMQAGQQPRGAMGLRAAGGASGSSAAAGSGKRGGSK